MNGESKLIVLKPGKPMQSLKYLIVILIGIVGTGSSLGVELNLASTDSSASQTLAFETRPTGIWQGKVGEGFRPAVQTLTLELGAVGGAAIFGSRQAHDLALTSLSYGYMWGRLRGEHHWYCGNWELRAELFGGGQFSPSSDWVIGLTPHLRYNFATGTRWVPFVDAGAGVTATGIGPPDLCDIFEFNLQANVGVHRFLRNNLALTFETGYLHLSCAGIHHPNQGLNGFKGMIGLTWFF